MIFTRNLQSPFMHEHDLFYDSRVNPCAALRQIFWSITILHTTVYQILTDVYCLIEYDTELLLVVRPSLHQNVCQRHRY